MSQANRSIPLFKLYNYIKSSTSYRVRIFLNLKKLQYTTIDINLAKNEHFLLQEYAAINMLRRVPVYVETNYNNHNWSLTQSIAIICYLDKLYPFPSIFPFNNQTNAQIHAFSMIIACDIHPINNLSVLNYLRENLCTNEEQIQRWYRHWILNGFCELERILSVYSGRYSFFDKISLADICLIPQVFNAIRFKIPLDNFPNIVKVYKNCLKLKPFIDAAP